MFTFLREFDIKTPRSHNLEFNYYVLVQFDSLRWCTFKIQNPSKNTGVENYFKF